MSNETESAFASGSGLRESVFVSMAAAGIEYLSLHASRIHREMIVDYGPASLSGRAFLRSLKNLYATTLFYFRVKKRFRVEIPERALDLCKGMETLLQRLRDHVINPIEQDLESRSLRDAFSSKSQKMLEGEGKGVGEKYKVEVDTLLAVAEESQTIYNKCCSQYPEIKDLLSA